MDFKLIENDEKALLTDHFSRMLKLNTSQSQAKLLLTSSSSAANLTVGTPFK